MERPRAPPPPELEFGGPWGAGALTLLLPLGLVGVVSASVGEGEGWGTPALALPTPRTLALVLAWVGAHGLGSCWRPPRTPDDTPGPPGPLRDLSWLLALGAALGGALALGVPLPPLCPLLPPLAAAASSIAFGVGLVLLVRRRLRGLGHGHPVYEFFVGGELGSPLEPPESLHWERVGLSAWLLVLAAALGEQQRLWGSPSLPLALVVAAQGGPGATAPQGAEQEFLPWPWGVPWGLWSSGLGPFWGSPPSAAAPAETPKQAGGSRGCRLWGALRPGVVDLPRCHHPEEPLQPQPPRPPSGQSPHSPHGHGTGAAGGGLVGAGATPR
ncbi:delta(14)-sterol reductase TM7SF2-like isoform X3 [Corvus hawaiiensis]|uniref:delta(14)-sterol reductase TM7SF2-like isoform X3 n=1 Tax=Corvus hawaiiensis TaxID=134902 RepID=UPI00201A03F4|nr:delta(14)-sterol reductase TM7SF2-like isoform X3 [Corvus hawaiiensis]